VAELVRDVFDDFGGRVLGVVQVGSEKPYGAELDGVSELRPRTAASHRTAPCVAVEQEVPGQLPVAGYGGYIP
jgi:hypothetical protein